LAGAENRNNIKIVQPAAASVRIIRLGEIGPVKRFEDDFEKEFDDDIASEQLMLGVQAIRTLVKERITTKPNLNPVTDFGRWILKEK
jgi:hypothetical protein